MDGRPGVGEQRPGDRGDVGVDVGADTAGGAQPVGDVVGADAQPVDASAASLSSIATTPPANMTVS